MTRTEWFPASVKPVREGWYELLCTGFVSVVRAKWDGRSWISYRYNCAMHVMAGDKWRGLTRTAYLKAGGK